MTVSLWQGDGTQPVREVDFLVVGAGLVGSCAAYFASQAGRDVVVVDEHDVALGASGRNAGFMITGLDTYYHHSIERYGEAVTREMWDLSRTTHRHLHGFLDAAAGQVQFDLCGSTLLAESAEEARDLEHAARAMDAAGIPHDYHSTDPLGRGYHAAIAQPQDAAVNPVQLTRFILGQSGAETVMNSAVYDIEQLPNDRVRVTSRLAIFEAQHVLLCTNAYSPFIDPYFVGKVIPTRAQVLVTEPLDEPVLATCGYSDYGYMYYRMTFDNRLLIGGARKNFREAEGDTIEDRLNPDVQSVLDAYLKQRFPDVTASVERRWAGIMGFSIDGLPLVGRLPHKPRVGFAVGFTGHGLAMGAGTAERAIDMLLNNANPGAVSVDRL